MPTDGGIDYRTYSRDDLVGAIQRIDRERYPLNFKAATDELARRGPDLTAELAAQTKPRQVVTAVRLSWGTFALSTLALVLAQLAHATRASPVMAALSWPFGLLVTWWILDQIGSGKNWARMVTVVLTPPWALINLLGLLALIPRSPAAGAAGLVSAALAVGAMCLLVGRPSREWFKRVERHSDENA